MSKKLKKKKTRTVRGMPTPMIEPSDNDFTDVDIYKREELDCLDEGAEEVFDYDNDEDDLDLIVLTWTRKAKGQIYVLKDWQAQKCVVRLDFLGDVIGVLEELYNIEHHAVYGSEYEPHELCRESIIYEMPDPDDVAEVNPWGALRDAKKK